MNNPGITDNVLFGAIVSLCLAAVTVVALEPLRSERRAAAERGFQRAARGLGLGPETGFSRCSWHFDPRVAGDDDAGFDGVAGLGEVSPWHAFALFPPPLSPPVAGE